MKSFYVYKIIDNADNILYIGETSNVKHRLHCHKNNQGMFYKRNDISLIIINEFKTKKEAFEYQLQLQNEYGFQTDLDKIIKSAKKGASIRMKRYNQHHSWKVAVNCFDYKTKKFVSEFKSTREASRIMGVKNIDKVLNRKYKQVGGYYFEYK